MCLERNVQFLRWVFDTHGFYDSIYAELVQLHHVGR